MNSVVKPANPNDVPSGALPLRSYVNAATLRRAALVALVLGSVLTLANQGDALLGAGEVKLLPVVLFYLTPLAVVSLSQAFGVRQAARDRRGADARAPTTESLLSTAFSHGIAARAALVGLFVGSLNGGIVTTALYLEQGRLDDLSFGLLAQAYSIPLVFGMLSQALAYRRAAGAAARVAP